MSQFRVKAEWWGYTPGEHFIFAQAVDWVRFITTNASYDLDVTPASVTLAGPVDHDVNNPSLPIVTKRKSWVWFSLKEICDRFSGAADGWQVKPLACASLGWAPVVPGSGAPSGQPDMVVPAVDPKGVEVRFRGQIDSGTITVAFAAPTAPLPDGKTITTGPAITKSTGGIHYDARGKYQLCPNGSGGYSWRKVVQEPLANSVVGPVDIRILWEIEA